MTFGVLIAGHSHTACLGLTRNEDLPPDLKILRNDPTPIEGVCYTWRKSQDLVEVIAPFATSKRLLLLWQGNFHLAKFLFLNHPIFDFVLTDGGGSPPQEQYALVPESLVAESLEPALGNLGAAILNLRKSQPDIKEIIVAATPPPKGDDQFILEHVRSEFGIDHYQSLIDPTSGVTLCPARVRYKLWALLMRMTKEKAASLNASYLPLPSGCQDESGFLRRELYYPDVTHANKVYGDLFLDHVSRQLF